jgi:hypothetical protein
MVFVMRQYIYTLDTETWYVLYLRESLESHFRDWRMKKSPADRHGYSNSKHGHVITVAPLATGMCGD